MDGGRYDRVPRDLTAYQRKGNVYEEYSGDVDFFLVYCHELESMYLVRENEFQTRTSLRVEEPEQVKPSINWAEEYEFDATWPPA